MKIGCLDCAFNYLPLPSFLAKPGALSMGFMRRLGLIEKKHYLRMALRRLSLIGFECVQILYEPKMPLKPYELSSICNRLGLKIASFGGYVNISGPGWTVVKDAINFARDADTDIVCFHSGAAGDGKNDLLIERLGAIADYAHDSGVRAALENSPSHIISTDKDLLDAVKKVGNLYVNLDTGNLNLASCDVVKAALRLKKYIVHTHIKDTVLKGNNRWAFRELGMGQVPIHDYLRTLKRIGYNGSLIIECEKCNNPERVMKNGIEYIRSGW